MDSYDEIPYDSHPITDTDPNRLAALGHLFGLPVADARDCRVLELGCAGAGNLAPLAWRYPASRFVGVELSARQVADARRYAEAASLANLEVIQGDILELDDSLGGFDYIIVHGVFSWVPEPVQERILALSRQLLNPGGIAYISYNTLPGWRMRGMLRDLLLWRIRATDDRREQLRQANEVLDRILRATGDLQAASAQYLREEIKRIRKSPPSYLFHEYLEEINQPLLFSDFVERARRHELAYLADTELHTAFASTLGDWVEQALADVEDGIDQEQYLDFIRNRNFRQSLLCRQEDLGERELDMERFEDLQFFAELVAPKSIDLRRVKGQPFRRLDSDNASNVTHPLTKAALQQLTASFPNGLTFGEMAANAAEQVRRAGAGHLAGQLDHLFGELFSLYAHGQVAAGRADESIYCELTARPSLHTLARAQCSLGHLELATPRHQTLTLDPLAARLADALDGSRDLDALTDLLLAGLDEMDGVPLPKESDKRRARVKGQCERLLHLFARQGILSP